ncbi:MAG: bis(5'-nucleosyl)-tetraphosphatase (symmetrical) YqeK [bacterium]
MTKSEIKQWLKSKLNDKLYRHSLAVQEMSIKLAEIYDMDKEKASLAGLIHDCAKSLPKKEMLSYYSQVDIPIDELIKKHPILLHAPLGAKIAKDELGIMDEEILHAIASHSLGSKNMTKLDKILYIADSAEPNRNYPEAEIIRKLAYDGDLDKALLEAIDQKIIYVIRKKAILHPLSVEVRNEILTKLNQRRHNIGA